MSLIDRALFQGTLKRWQSAARRAAAADLDDLRGLRTQARQLRANLDQVIDTAAMRLALPRIGSEAFPTPPNTDWSWRPDLFKQPLRPRARAAIGSKEDFGAEATLFHDCQVSELCIRQERNRRDTDLAPFSIDMDVFGFDGSFLSMVLYMPQDACQGLKRRHLIRMDVALELERKIEIFARLNVKHGPNTEQIVRELPLHEEDVMVEFDLAYTKLNEKRVDRMWIDLIFENPQMNRMTFRDLTFCRLPRAEL